MCVFSVKSHNNPRREVCTYTILIFQISRMDQERLNNLCEVMQRIVAKLVLEPMLSDSSAHLTTMLYSVDSLKLILKRTD